MARKTEKTDDIAPNPLMESGIGKMIQVVRGKQVLLDRDLAALYGVETKRINEQVKRNIERFPKDFCFQLDATEHKFLRSQIATTKTETRGGRQYFPYAFTEQGVAMLSFTTGMGSRRLLWNSRPQTLPSVSRRVTR